MTLRPEYSLGHSAYNDFLFGSLGPGEGGTEITVLSALSRLGIDPWQEAERLAALPREAAAQALADTIARLPAGAFAASPEAGRDRVAIGRAAAGGCRRGGAADRGGARRFARRRPARPCG